MHTPTQADIDRLTEVCRANQSTVDIYKAERDALVARVAELEGALSLWIDNYQDGYIKGHAYVLKQSRAALKGTP